MIEVRPGMFSAYSHRPVRAFSAALHSRLWSPREVFATGNLMTKKQ